MKSEYSRLAVRENYHTWRKASGEVIIVTVMGSIGLPELLVLVTVAVLLLGGLFRRNSLRQRADELGESLQQLAERNPRKQPPEKTVAEWTILAIKCVIAWLVLALVFSGMDGIGIQELVVLFLVGLLLFGPKDPRQLADVITKATQEFQQGDQRWQLRERTVRDSTMLAVVFLAAYVVLCWVLTRL